MSYQQQQKGGGVIIYLLENKSCVLLKSLPLLTMQNIGINNCVNQMNMKYD